MSKGIFAAQRQTAVPGVLWAVCLLVTFIVSYGCGEEDSGGVLPAGPPAHETEGKEALAPGANATAGAKTETLQIPTLQPSSEEGEPKGGEDQAPSVSKWRVAHENRHPARLALDPTGKVVYATNPEIGSIFRYNQNLVLDGELQGFGKPLGIAVNKDGTLFIGDDRSNSIRVVRQDGTPAGTLGQGLLDMPNALVVDSLDRLYVADSGMNRVRLLAREGTLIRDFAFPDKGDGVLQFPSALALIEPNGDFGGELLVADQIGCRVHVFALDGTAKRTLGQPMEASASDWEGKFVRIQSLALDGQGGVHMLDSFQHEVQVLDLQSGQFRRAYGQQGNGAGMLKVPLDLVLIRQNALVANWGSGRLEFISNANQKGTGEVSK